MKHCSRTFLLLLIAAIGIGANASSFDATKYSSSTTIGALDYTVYWNVAPSANELHLAFKVKTLGWVGFGIGELSSGSMPGADIITGGVFPNGTGYATDRWSYDRVLPVVDDCQDVFLVNAEQTTDGYTIVEVTRSINSTDPQDRSIVPGPNRVIVSFSSSNSDVLAYHGANRLTSEITFFGEGLYPQTSEPNERTIDLRLDNFLVPDVETQYVCQTFVVPTDQEYHITQIEPLVNSTNVDHVHHFVAHIAANMTLDPTQTQIPLVTQYMTAKGCTPLQGQVVQGWTGMLSAWAAGGGSQYTPPEAGFPMGSGAAGAKFIILEIHYNNPTGKGGYYDNSGIRLHYTTTLRPYDADVLIVGDPFTSFAPIPAGVVMDYESECLSSCTETFPTDLKVFGSFPHMHQAGTMAWSTQWRNDSLVREIGRIEYFSYNHQQVLPVNFTIQRGDRFNFHCIYDTTDRVNVTRFGMASVEEMCMHFFFYYPRMTMSIYGLTYPNNFCGRFYGDPTGQDLTKNGSICGSPFGGNYTQNNPLHYDPPGGMDKTFGETPTKCATNPSTATQILSWLSGCFACVLLLLLV